MINKHKTQTVETSKSSSKPKNDYTPAPTSSYNIQESDDDDKNDDDGLFANNNLQKAQAREREVRDKLAEVSFFHLLKKLNILLEIKRSSIHLCI